MKNIKELLIKNLVKTAKIRFPKNKIDRSEYIKDVLDKSEFYDKKTYKITKSNFILLRLKYGEMPRKPISYKESIYSVGGAIKSVVKTGVLGIHVVTDKQYEERLNICRDCPGNHAIWKVDKEKIEPKDKAHRDDIRDNLSGRLYTCGPLLKQSESTCGCVLSKKAKDTKQQCPNLFWPTLEGLST